MPLYCGDKAILPAGYAGFDTRYNCLRRGVGVGKMLQCRVGIPWYVFLVIGLLLLILVFIG